MYILKSDPQGWGIAQWHSMAYYMHGPGLDIKRFAKLKELDFLSRHLEVFLEAETALQRQREKLLLESGVLQLQGQHPTCSSQATALGLLWGLGLTQPQ